MPSGKTHLTINGLLSTALLGGLHLSGAVPLNSGGGLGLLAGLIVGTVWITPDIDMKGVRTAPLRAWGPLALLWSPLLGISRHRGVSHTYLRGPALRLVYISIILSALATLASWAWHSAGLAFAPWPAVTAALSKVPQDQFALQTALSGYWLAQWMHLGADGIQPRWKHW